MDKIKDFLTIKEIANLLQVHIVTVRRYIRSGKLLALFLGKEYRVQKEDFKDFLEKRKVKNKI